MNIAPLLEGWKPGYSLPQAMYNDSGVYEHDMERVFRRQWLAVGHVSMIRQTGAYFLYQIGAESIIIVRGRDDAIHAMYNVCRHRGSHVCYEATGVARGGLVCPYHAWTYGFDGQLRGAPAMPEDFDKSKFGLKPCHVRTLGGVIFICLADEPPDFDMMHRDVAPVFEPHELESAAIGAQMTWTIDANWKLVIENFSECYHCGPAHPEYCSVMDHAIPDCTGAQKQVDAYQAQVSAWNARVAEMGHVTGRIEPAEGTTYYAARIPIGEGKLSQARDGRQVAPLLGRYKENDGGLTAFRNYPGGYILASPDHAVVIRFTPLGPLVHPDAIEGVDYKVSELKWLWQVTTDQDKTIIDHNQRGVNSSAYRPGPYSNSEKSVVRFMTWYLDQVRS